MSDEDSVLDRLYVALISFVLKLVHTILQGAGQFHSRRLRACGNLEQIRKLLVLERT
jgi:hypothetical protein